MKCNMDWLVKTHMQAVTCLSYSPVVIVGGYRSRGPGFDSRHYQISREILGLERGPLSFVSTTEELLERKSRGFGLENREYGREDPSR
jgi:hypothetical protein